MKTNELPIHPYPISLSLPILLSLFRVLESEFYFVSCSMLSHAVCINPLYLSNCIRSMSEKTIYHQLKFNQIQSDRLLMFVVRLRLHAMFLFSTMLMAVRLHNCRQICEMSSNESRQKNSRACVRAAEGENDFEM